jgi:hypothetical protein
VSAEIISPTARPPGGFNVGMTLPGLAAPAVAEPTGGTMPPERVVR